jgi:hypothetical protein
LSNPVVALQIQPKENIETYMESRDIQTWRRSLNQPSAKVLSYKGIVKNFKKMMR